MHFTKETLHYLSHYVSRHFWDIFIAGLIIYEILDTVVTRRKAKKEAHEAERMPPAISNTGGEPGPLRFTGRAGASGGPISGPQNIDRSCMITIANSASRPVTVAAKKLLIDERQIPFRALFKRAETNQGSRQTENASMGGNACLDYELLLRFAETAEPRQVNGKLYFSSSNRGSSDADLFPLDVTFP